MSKRPEIDWGDFFLGLTIAIFMVGLMVIMVIETLKQ